MEISFDDEKRSINKNVQTRIWAPTHKNDELIVLDEGSPLPTVRPQPGSESVSEPAPAAPRHDRSLLLSRILILLSVFMMAATAIFALRGNVELTDVYRQINTLDDDIAAYKEDISQIIKQQSAYDDYGAINETNLGAGRVRVWNSKD